MTAFLCCVVLVLSLGLSGCGKTSDSKPAADASDFQPFYRIDRDAVDAWKGPLDNVRILTAGKYAFETLDEKYGVDPAFVPSKEGLDTLNSCVLMI